MHNFQPRVEPRDLKFCFAFVLVAGRNLFPKEENTWFLCVCWV